MKTRFLLLFVFVFTSVINSFSQNRNSVWCFGDSAGIDFSNTANPVTFASGMDGRGSCASIAGTNGNLLFYSFTVAGAGGWTTHIYNYLHSTMSGANSITGEAWYNEIQIIPKPGSSNLYYVFTVGLSNPIKGIYYSLIDMNQNGGTGQVVLQNIQLDNVKRADCLQAIKHGNGRDWWIISKLQNNNGTIKNRFYTYLVTPFGISDSTIQDLGDATDFAFQKIIFNSDGTKFMLINQRGFMCEYNFDRCSGIISNPSIIFPEQSGTFNRYFWEGAYSSDDSIFYISTYGQVISDSSYLIQFNLNSSNIGLSCDTLDRYLTPAGSGDLRLAPDDKIYFSRAYESPSVWSFPYADTMYNYINMNLSVINSPDSLGAACNYQPFSFYLGGKRTYYGLPNNPNYSLGPLAGSPCDSLTGIKNNEATKENTVSVFPNPVTDKLTITTHNNDLSEIILYDIATRKLLHQKFTNTVTLNTARLAKGMYLYEVRNKKGVVKKGKVVKPAGR